jgi:hypothetical protein
MQIAEAKNRDDDSLRQLLRLCTRIYQNVASIFREAWFDLANPCLDRVIRTHRIDWLLSSFVLEVPYVTGKV